MRPINIRCKNKMRRRKSEWIRASKRVYGKKSVAKRNAESWRIAGHHARVKKVSMQIGTSKKPKVKGYAVFIDKKAFK